MTTRKQISKYKAAHKTLEHLGYSYHGGEMWAPPIGTKPNFDLIDRLRADVLFDKNLIESLQDSLAVRTKERDELAASVATARNEALEQAARNEALEQAAKICDEQGGLSADVAAMRIRNLKTGSM